MIGAARRWGAGSWPGRRAVGLGFGLGALVAVGQAPLGWWWLALPALAGLIRLVAVAPRGRGWIGWFGGAGYFAAALNWIVEPFLIEPEVYGWMAPFALLFLSFGLALFWAVAAGVGARGRYPALGFAVALGVAELARGYVLTGFPWALVGHIWVGHAPAQVVALIGPSGLTLLTLLAGGLLALWRPAPVVGAVALVAAGFGFGQWRLAQAEPAAQGAIVRLVQPNAEQGLKWDPEQAHRFFERLLEFTKADTEAGARPDLVIWPETAVPYLMEEYPEVAARIAEAGRSAPVAAGVQRVEGFRFWNSLAVVGPGGVITGRYDKHHLVPFGEYIPFGDLMYRWFGLVAFAAQEGNGYSPGVGPAVLDLGPRLGVALPLICYEAVFPQDLRRVPGRADWILQITNDAWFGEWTGPYQHLAQAQLRAIEQGLPMVRVANTGITALIDARGRVVESLPLGEAGYLDVALPGALPPTPYQRWGEVPVGLLLAGLGLWLLALGRRKAA